MARNTLVIGSKFTPYSFDEMIKPLQMYGEAYRQQESELGDVNNKIGIWENRLDPNLDTETYNRYKSYSDEVKRQADILATEGLSSANRGALGRIKRQYMEDITPIEQAYTRREEMRKQQEDLLAKDPTRLIEKPATAITIDDLIKNPNLSIRNTSGALLEQEALKAASMAAKAIQEDPKYSSILGGQYFQSKLRNGYTVPQILAAASDDPNAPKELTNIVNSVYQSSGLSDWADENINKQAMEYIKRGLYGAIGEDKFGTLSNKQWEIEARNTSSKSNKEKQPSTRDYDTYITPNQLSSYKVSGSEILNKDGNLNQSLSYLFDKSGNLKKEVDLEGLPNALRGDYNSEQNYARSMKQSLDEFNSALIDAGINPNLGKSEIEKQLKEINSANANIGDVNTRYRNRVSLDSTAGREISNKIAANIGTGKVEIIKGYDKDGNYKVIDKTTTKKLFGDDKADVLQVNMDSKTGQLSFKAKTEDGEIIEALLPKGVFSPDTYMSLDNINKQYSNIKSLIKNNKNSNNPVMVNINGEMIDAYEALEFIESYKDSLLKEALNVNKVSNVNE